MLRTDRAILQRTKRASWISASTYERFPGVTFVEEEALGSLPDDANSQDFLMRVVPADHRLGLPLDLADKSVAICGNGLVSGCGPAIDGHDEVVRLNGMRNWRRDSVHDGERATLWAGHPVFVVSRGPSGVLQPLPAFERLVDAGANLWALSPLHISVGAYRWLEGRGALDRLLVAPAWAAIQDLLSRSLDAQAVAKLFSIPHVRAEIVGRPVFEHLLTGTRLLLLLELCGVRRISLYGVGLFVNSSDPVWFGHDLSMDMQVILDVKRRLADKGGSLYWEEEALVREHCASLPRAFLPCAAPAEPPAEQPDLTPPAEPATVRSKKALILNDTALCYHYGCFATSTALGDLLREDGYDVASYPVTLTHSLKPTPESVEELRDPGFFASFCHSQPLICRSMRDADLVVVNGEGTLHGFRPAPRNLLYLAFLAKQHFGRPTYLVNHSLFPADKREHLDANQAEFYRLALSGLDGVAVREPLSRGNLARLGIESVQSFDLLPLFAAQAGVTAHSEPREPALVLIGVGVGWNAALAEKYALALENALPASARLVFLNGAPGLEPLDERVCLPVMAKILPNIVSSVPFSGCLPTHRARAQEWLRLIARAGLVVSGRFHHAVAALALGTPLVALSSHTHKIEGTYQLLGLGQAMPDPHGEGFRESLEAALGGQPVVTSAAQRELLLRLGLSNALWRQRKA